jgi:hypothetical protein
MAFTRSNLPRLRDGSVRASLWFMCAVLVAWPACAADSLVPLSGGQDFGDLSPSQAAAPLDGIKLLIQSGRAYRVVASPRVDLEANPSAPAGDEIQILTSAGSWLPMTRDLPIELATGPATPPGGTTLAFPMRANISFDSPPGQRHAHVRLTLNDGAETQIEFKYDVPPVAFTREISTEQVQQIDPAVRGTYVIERRTYEVTSNVPWAIDALLRDPFTQRGNSVTLVDGHMAVKVPETNAQPLALNQRVVVATGMATGSSPTVVRLEFVVTITGDELAGDYAGDVDVNAQPLDGQSAATVARK